MNIRDFLRELYTQPEGKLALLAFVVLLLFFIPLQAGNKGPIAPEGKIPASFDSEKLAPRIDAKVEAKGGELLITAEVEDVHGVDVVVADISGFDQVHLKRIDGTAHQGTWQAAWTPRSAEKQEYITVIATSIVGITSSSSVSFTGL